MEYTVVCQFNNASTRTTFKCYTLKKAIKKAHDAIRANHFTHSYTNTSKWHVYDREFRLIDGGSYYQHNWYRIKD